MNVPPIAPRLAHPSSRGSLRAMSDRTLPRRAGMDLQRPQFLTADEPNAIVPIHFTRNHLCASAAGSSAFRRALMTTLKHS